MRWLMLLFVVGCGIDGLAVHDGGLADSARACNTDGRIVNGMCCLDFDLAASCFACNGGIFGRCVDAGPSFAADDCVRSCGF